MDILLIASIFLRPCGAGKNTTKLAKYPRVLYVKQDVFIRWFANSLLITWNNTTNSQNVHAYYLLNHRIRCIYSDLMSFKIGNAIVTFFLYWHKLPIGEGKLCF